MIKKNILFLLIISILQSCASSNHKRINKKTLISLHDDFYKNQFTGFMVFDPFTKDTLVNYNSEKYFTPASNTKIATLYTALSTLPDSIPTLKYIVDQDTIHVQPTGDPTLLHPYFKDSTLISFLRKFKNINLDLTNFKDDKYGPGWAWEDYAYYYQPEVSKFPLYGNVVSIHKTDSLNITPLFFKKNVSEIAYNTYREELENTFYFNPSRKDTLHIPFITDSIVTKQLLEKALNKNIKLETSFPKGIKNTLYSLPSDSVYKRMMFKSDNFLAEQLLILSSAVLSDTLSGSIARKHMLSNNLSDLKEKPRWVDGSGLSRYNLFSPASFVHILSNLYNEQPRERILNIFPAGGTSGTLKNSYKNGDKPYIYAKSGSLGNNYSLSGYLITNSGKTLIFSFMNNHYTQPTSEVKKRMEAIFENIRDHY
ncbi:D-alanyl-D-alanine carboxypeptidase [Cellulophaga sp. HaHaR_3_176]|uniref:D-alanyl-D-alanine carboxypeptidase/D-alanyl-D-alanine-endopeptidase n=1 Tax=Cellulophaga sp. HaHaR_3_176 TaxID=1942464 RepID=UPI001C1F278D|nr:D-alanyl-D-alanine carboxypeptidase [Cellulophaga sp. HaHaR_3_176]QWX82678.1 D-alanyl-D-alanine carboxypeptidase [Cellulophaga sp. HaHaR_3_176]